MFIGFLGYWMFRSTPIHAGRRLFGNQENWNGEVNIFSFFLMFLISSFTFLSKFWGLSWERGIGRGFEF